MAKVTDKPPARVRRDLKNLNADLDLLLPPKRLDDNLLIATWNIRAAENLKDFGRVHLTELRIMDRPGFRGE